MTSFVDRSTRSNTESGQALAIVVGIIAIMIMASAVVVDSVTSAGHASRQNTDVQIAQTTAEAGAAYFYAALEATPRWTPTIATNQFPGTMFGGYRPGNWVQLNGAALVPCPSPLASCVSFADNLQALPFTAPGGSATTPFAIVIQVDARTNCRFAGAAGCSRSRLVQRITPRQYLDYLDFTGSQLLDPALVVDSGASYSTWFASCTNQGASGAVSPLSDASLANSQSASTCPIPAYIGPTTYAPADQIDGPIATNDAKIYVCGTTNSAASQPAFTVPPQATSSTPTAQYPVPGTNSPAGCSGPAPPGTTLPATPLPSSSSDLTVIAASQDRYRATTTLVLDGNSSSSSYTANGTTKSWPATGVIYVAGDAYVQGTVCQPVTLAASGNIYITGNLTYSCPNASTGLIADNAVVAVPSTTSANQITCWANPDAGQCMTVDAAVMALGTNDLPPETGTPAGGSFYLQGWDTLLPPDGSINGTTDQCTGAISVCALVFDGSITEQFRGAFGQYAFSSPTASLLTTGIAKQFVFDTGLAVRQPPYFLEPTTSTWQRAGATFSGALQS